MSGEYNLGDFEKGEILKKQMTFGRLFKPGSAARNSIGIFFNKEISYLTLIDYTNYNNNTEINTEYSRAKWKVRFGFICLKIAESNERFNFNVYELILEKCILDNQVILALAKNPYISLKIATKLNELDLPVNQMKDLQLVLISNSSEELTTSFLKKITRPIKILSYLSPIEWDSPEYLETINESLTKNLHERVKKLGIKLQTSVSIFGGQANFEITKEGNIDLTKSIRACNELGEFLLSNSDPKEGSIVKYEEVQTENIFDLLNPNNTESIIGMVARIKEFFAEFESKWGIIGLNVKKLNSPLWRVAHKLSEDFCITLADEFFWKCDKEKSSNCGRSLDTKYKFKVINIINAKFEGETKITEKLNKFNVDLGQIIYSSLTINDVDWKIAFEFRNINLSDEELEEKMELNFKELVKYRNVYKHLLSELQKTELQSTEDLELERMKEITEQKLLAEGPLAIAQKEFEEALSVIGDPLKYVKAEMLRRMHEKTLEIDEKFRIQPFLQSFWDEINQNTFELEQLKSFRPPKSITNEDGKRVLETHEESKSAFFKLINNLLIGNGNITRALNPNNDPSIPSPQAQIKDFYKQLCAKYIPESVLDETGITVNAAEVDNNIFNNPQLNLPPIYLEFLSTLLDKLIARYEEALKERVEYEKYRSQDSIYLNITNKLKNERLKITRGLDSSVSDLIIAEIQKIIIVQNALEKGLRVTKIR
jgi:hypothetical protein